MSNLKWWAYRHVNGGVHMKRFHGQDAVEDAYDSDFVDDVLDPFVAETRNEAELIVRESRPSWFKQAVAP